MTTKETPATFRSSVNMVVVPVVVRDKAGKANGLLKQEDFRLFDRGKEQTIVRFSVEKPNSQKIKVARNDANPLEAPPDELLAPDHFVAYTFDDIHSNTGDLIRARLAVEKHLESSRQENTRVGIFTTSGRVGLEFTDEMSKFRDTLLRITPQPIGRSTTQDCPNLEFYTADQITNKNNKLALDVMVADTIACANLPPDDPQSIETATRMVQAGSSRVLQIGTQESLAALRTVSELARRLSSMPGKRVLVLVSPGFMLTPGERDAESTAIERAVKANVVINSIDIRGLYADFGDVSRQSAATQQAIVMLSQFHRENARMNSDVLAELSTGTGGSHFQNNNDLPQGLRQASDVPENYYLLSFSPQNLKLDGGFHELKVSLRIPAGQNISARRGYFAPRRLSSADETAKEEISMALFSREEMKDIPVDLHTQFFKTPDGKANLTILAKIAIKQLQFRKENGRNLNDVIVVAGIFDRNANYLQGLSKTLTMRLREETLSIRLANGITVRNDFKIPPGQYFIRVVVRDAEGQNMAAQNTAVDIPY
jgi:VWFA-related protein